MGEGEGPVHIANDMAILPFAAAAIGALYRERRLPAARIKEVQAAKLRFLLEHARAHTPLGKERIGISALPPLDAIPPITKAELMERFSDSLIDPSIGLAEVESFVRDRSDYGRLLRGRYVAATTSGTTGKVGYFLTDARSFARQNGALFARILRHRLIPREVIRFCFGRRYRMAMTIAIDGRYISRLVGGFSPWLSRALIQMRLFSIMDDRQQTIRALNRYRPHYLHGYPTYLETLAHAQLQGDLHLEPEFISLGSEPVSALAKATLQKAFPMSEISETYGATECLVMANQCRLGQLHVNEDFCVLEPVDEEGRPVPPGTQSAKVLVTNLENLAQPLYRYELPDSVTILPGPCECGAGLTRIRVEGRTDDTFYLSDAAGRFQAHPPLPFETLFLNLPGLAQYQLVHEAQNQLKIRFVREPDAELEPIGQELSRRFYAYLEQNALGATVRCQLEPVDRIEREPTSHKIRQVWSKVPRPVLYG